MTHRTPICMSLPMAVCRLALLQAILIALVGCTNSVTQQTNPPATQVAPAASEQASPINLTCPVTIPNGSQPPNSTHYSGWHGNGVLWVNLWPYDVIFVVPGQIDSDGSLTMKIDWVRGPKTIGPLTVEGHRIDAQAPPLQSKFTDYGDKGFQPTTTVFPTEGCWEVKGKVGDASLTFVTLVLKVKVNPYIGP